MRKTSKDILFSLTLVIMCVIALAVCNPNTGGNNVENIVTIESQTIGLTGVSNARQLGEYITADGKKIELRKNLFQHI